MADLLFVVITIAFFAAAAGFVHVCDRIVRRDDAVDAAPTAPATPAPARSVPEPEPAR